MRVPFLDLGAAWLNLAVFDGVLIRDLVSQIFAIAPTSLFLMIAVSYAVGLLRTAIRSRNRVKEVSAT